ncbi:MAG: DUF3486 family protein [Zoogloea sp.]|uniref:DUF3486 family protein n=1 Tax=Zoogloea sp. TaxID=49181 RepID=UPI00260B3C3C|nr:DUF3486 family protein [Zoogloea sp.]MDD3329677.1 DUF3486 family protein [Zoogloea sp.]
MARKSSIDRLPENVKAYVTGLLADGKMTLDELIADLQARFPEEAAADALPSRSAVHRYGAKLERRLAAIRASTEAAKIIRAQAGDGEDARSEALTALIQTELFEAILDVQEASADEIDPAERVGMLSSAAKNVATLTRSSVTLKRFQSEVRAKLEAKMAALEAEGSSGKGRRFDAETLRIVREEIYGIV